MKAGRNKTIDTDLADGAEYLVAEIANPVVTAWTDIAVSPKSTYFYVLQVVNTNDLASWSNELRAQTPAGMEAPGSNSLGNSPQGGAPDFSGPGMP